MQKFVTGLCLAVLLICGSVFGYEVVTHGKPDPSKPYLMVDLVYNFAVYERPFFLLPKSHPTYVIWLEDKKSGYRKSIFVTHKAGQNDWHFAKRRPEAIPVWYGVNKIEKRQGSFDIDAVSGATPKDETVRIYWPVSEDFQGKAVNLYIEANNSFDFNDHYTRKKGTPGYSGANGQPSLVWQASLDLAAETLRDVSPKIIGHGHIFGKNHRLFEDISGITTAAETFRDIRISYVAP